MSKEYKVDLGGISGDALGGTFASHWWLVSDGKSVAWHGWCYVRVAGRKLFQHEGDVVTWGFGGIDRSVDFGPFKMSVKADADLDGDRLTGVVNASVKAGGKTIASFSLKA